jgi:Integrase zinc binding domain
MPRIAAATSWEDDLELKLRPDRNSDLWSRQENGLVMFKGKVFVPGTNQLQEEVMNIHHDGPMEGHPGVYRSIELVERNYWWPTLRKDVESYVSGC